ncbi:MAG: hypothetical protein WC512_01890 [Candidatus Omnitrophota bacterium]
MKMTGRVLIFATILTAFAFFVSSNVFAQAESERPTIFKTIFSRPCRRIRKGR